MAHRLGISRSTLLRRVGTRRALDSALAELGEVVGSRATVAQRAVQAAAELICLHGVAGVTLDAVATSALCSVQAIHAQIGGRDALLTATFERFSPLEGITAVLTSPPADLATGVREVYRVTLDATLGTPVIAALLIEAAARPRGGLARYVRERYAVTVSEMVQAWLMKHRRSGTIRAIRPQTLLVLFGGPLLGELVRQVATGGHADAAYRRRVADELAASFCRAVHPD